MYRQRNERKIEILSYALKNRVFTAYEVAVALDIPPHYAGTYLKRYHKMGLLYRHKNSVYYYSLSPKGKERLQYLLSTMPKTYEKLLA